MEARHPARFLLRMGRVSRPQMPGVAFHITARTQGKAPLFDERLRTTIEQHIREGVNSSDALLLAHVVMPNHFHIVLRQGMHSLGWIMQPIMRRTALLVQRAHVMKGHVFERRFRSLACENADHLRRAIVYTHLNPRRARLCSTDADYAWSSGHLYRRKSKQLDVCDVAVNLTLQMFGKHPSDSHDDLQRAYCEYLEWRIEKDRHDEEGTVCPTREPLMPAGDAHFLRSFCALPPTNGRPSRDLRDYAIKLLSAIDEQLSIDSLRKRNLPRNLSAARRELIAGLLQARYKGCDIANFLRTADSTVSRVAIAMRYAQTFEK
jgi:REP element-mobilizing transposase RayT